MTRRERLGCRGGADNQTLATHAGSLVGDKCKEMLTRHPLSIVPHLTCRDDSVLHLTFYCLVNLNIMTVKLMVTSATELITHIVQVTCCLSSVLSCLYPGDHGKKTESSQSVPV